MLGNEIEKIKEQIVAVKNIPNVTQAVLKEYAGIITELNNLRSAIANYKTFDQLKKYQKKMLLQEMQLSQNSYPIYKIA